MAVPSGIESNTADTPFSNPTIISNPIKLLSLNCRGLNQTKRRQLLFTTLCKFTFDIIFLQETHAPAKNNWSQEWLNISGGRSVFPQAKNKASAGVAVLFNKNFEFKDRGIVADPNGHFLSMSITQDNLQYQLINVYGPSSEKEQFYEGLEEYIFFSGPMVISGDFNFTEKPIDREGPGKFSARNQKGSLAFSKIKANHNLSDVWRTLNPKKREFTYFEPAAKKQQVRSRIDRAYLSEQFMHADNKAEIIPLGFSDHSLISVTFQPTDSIQAQKGPGYPKINTQILDHKPFVDEIKQLVLELQEMDQMFLDGQGEVDHLLTWDIWKCKFL